MPEILTPHNESLMPITMGSPIRVPDYAYPNWGLTPTEESEVIAAYMAEWSLGTEAQLGLVSQATIAAGFGNYPELLRQKTAGVVTDLVNHRSFDHTLTILDIGAGPGLSALAVYQGLSTQLRSCVFFILVEPSTEALKTAESLMEKYLIRSKSLHGTDLEILGQIKSASVDILTAVASIHHHSHMPLMECTRVLKPGGFAVFADWHHDLWEHPNRVLRFLERFDWPKKEEGLENWIRAYYPQTLDDPDKNLHLTPEELMAREQITRFWLAYKEMADRANLGTNAIWPLEGHRPVARYVEDLQTAGFMVNSPHQLLPDSSLLMVTVAQKPI